ncbi:VOC family protein [Pseudonocardia lutea]|uniref:VOC family protein n=1 Tax=Pseudonocardia lutea TaxID=2172015 RepID=A0ABW1IAN9_9PSEU
MSDQPTVGNVLYPTSDVDGAVAFYGKALGLPVKFQDGSRFAMLDGGGTSFALAGAEEDVTAGRVAASLRVADVADAVRAAVAAGASVIRDVEQGPHETRAVLRDPWGNLFVVYRRS